MASIVKRGARYFVVVYQDGKQHWISGFSSWTAANKHKHEVETQRDGGVFVAPVKKTLSKYLATWLTDYVTPNLSPKTLDSYRRIIQTHINPALGNVQLSKVTPGSIQQLYSTKTQSTARHCHVCLSSAFTVAVKQGLIIRNPCVAVTAPVVQKRDMHTLDEDSVKVFLESVRHTEYHALFYLALYTGMRRSEMLALRWSDVNLELCELHISRALHYINKEFIYRQPKTAGSRRMIALTPSTTAVLREHKARQDAQRLLTKVKEFELVFCQPDGTPLVPGTVSNAWHYLSKRAGLDVRLHDARHTHATLLLKQGVHPKIVQERLGHSSIGMTLDTYSHILPGLQAAAAKKFDESLAEY